MRRFKWVWLAGLIGLWLVYWDELRDWQAQRMLNQLEESQSRLPEHLRWRNRK